MKLRLLGLAAGGPTPLDGQYLKEYDPSRDGADPDGRPMTAHLVTTPDPEEALDLPPSEMLALWRMNDPRQPTREDGRPNRPLTAYTAEFLP